jgi:hypothetical protein
MNYFAVLNITVFSTGSLELSPEKCPTDVMHHRLPYRLLTLECKDLKTFQRCGFT